MLQSEIRGPNPSLRVVPPRCIFCLSSKNVKTRHGVRVCDKCATEMPGAFGGEMDCQR